MSKYYKINNFDTGNGDGLGVTVFFTGCPFKCEGCFNKELWDFNVGSEWTQKEVDKVIKLCENPYIDHLSILGGEPLAFENRRAVANLILQVKKKIKKENFKIWVWTGYKLSDLSFYYLAEPYIPIILYNIDYLIDGPFIENKKDLTLKWRGSSNQKINDLSTLLSKK